MAADLQPVAHAEQDEPSEQDPRQLERPVSDNVLLSLRYAYFDNASNVDVFDYNREILGMYATFRFTP